MHIRCTKGAIIPTPSLFCPNNHQIRRSQKNNIYHRPCDLWSDQVLIDSARGETHVRANWVAIALGSQLATFHVAVVA